MDKTEFEKAISPYTTKQVDPDSNAVEYLPTFRISRKTIDIRTGERVSVGNIKDEFTLPNKSHKPTSGLVPKAVTTPRGVFNSVKDAAKATGMSMPYIYKKIREHINLSNKEYYFND